MVNEDVDRRGIGEPVRNVSHEAVTRQFGTRRIGIGWLRDH